jgi:hypothetical protein
MIIEYNDTACDFVDLYIGQAFTFYEDGEKYICMKIEGLEEGKYNLYVNLANGEVYEIEPHQRVYKIKAKIIVE